ncbi:hypothetical protein GDO86_017709 [Hymenochirus boettgeri]|uniref:Olfactory receptor n=1 Tax=Hymenochirus boettgeri TaxID=247094 RepID=A0A8T2IR45_9PIPI|nr:hypothetical protein GDO86_017709 [Hymenochirus boettgeri]
MLGNGVMVLLIIKDGHLHTPMYTFLANLSIMDMLFSSITVPKLIRDLICGKGDISVNGCIVQLFFVITFAASESPLLSFMAFDRYVAICNPLYYKIIMNNTLCFRLISGSWLLGIFYSLLHTMFTKNLIFCGPNQINHVFCDVLALLPLACADITLNITIRSLEGRKKAFSTCASHIMVVSLYYVTLIATYLHPIDNSSGSKDRTAAVVYTVVTPLFNPLVYSLRNADVKKALMRLF